MEKSDLSELEQKIRYTFSDKNLLIEAISHRSFVNENNEVDCRDNERLEFLGDAVLNLVVGHILMHKFPDLMEGDLSRMRAALVNESRLAKIARSVEFGKFIRLGKGEMQSNGSEKKSILADAYEALVAAVYLDGGFGEAFRIIKQNYSGLIDSMTLQEFYADPKSCLQEVVQVRQGMIPTYTVIEESGPDHDKTFRVEVRVGDICEDGIGKSKKKAEQHAAGKALIALIAVENKMP